MPKKSKERKGGELDLVLVHTSFPIPHPDVTNNACNNNSNTHEYKECKLKQLARRRLSSEHKKTRLAWSFASVVLARSAKMSRITRNRSSMVAPSHFSASPFCCAPDRGALTKTVSALAALTTPNISPALPLPNRNLGCTLRRGTTWRVEKQNKEASKRERKARR